MPWARGGKSDTAGAAAPGRCRKAELAPWLALAGARRGPLACALAPVPSQAAPEAPTAAKALTTFAIPGTAMPVLHRLDQGLIGDL